MPWPTEVMPLPDNTILLTDAIEELSLEIHTSVWKA